MKKNNRIYIIILILGIIVWGVVWFLTSDKLTTVTSLFSSVDDIEEVQSIAYPNNDYTTNLDTSIVVGDNEEILITSSGTYEFSGEYSEHTIVVNVDKDVDKEPVYIVLNNAQIESNSAAPINIIEAKDVIIVLEENTVNTITQGDITTADEDFPSGAIYSKADTAIIGTGKLIVDTKYNDGINSRDDLVIEDATITVNAVGDGIVGKDMVAIRNVMLDIVSGKDGIKSTNTDDETLGYVIIESGTFNIDAGTDGISAKSLLQIEDGDFNIVTGGGFVEVLNEITVGEGSGGAILATTLLEDSMRCLKGNDILLNGGELVLESYEDTIHANNDLTITGGTYTITSGDDGVHADNTLYITGGTITIIEGYEGLEGNIVVITGGEIDVKVLDDAFNAEEYGRITGGTIYLKSSGDGIDSNGDMYIEGGTITIENTAIYTGGDSEIDVTGQYTHTGGTVKDQNGNDLDAETMQGGGPGNMMQQERPRR